MKYEDHCTSLMPHSLSPYLSYLIFSPPLISCPHYNPPHTVILFITAMQCVEPYGVSTHVRAHSVSTHVRAHLTTSLSAVFLQNCQQSNSESKSLKKYNKTQKCTIQYSTIQQTEERRECKRREYKRRAEDNKLIFCS